MRIDLRGPRGSDAMVPGTISLAVAHVGGGKDSSAPLRWVKIGPGEWISWGLIWIFITGEY